MTSVDVKQGSGYFNKSEALHLSFSSNTRILPITLDDNAMRKGEPSGIGMWASTSGRKHRDKGSPFPLKSWAP